MSEADQEGFGVGVVRVEGLLLHAQEEGEHTLLLLKHQQSELPDWRRKRSVRSVLTRAGIEPEQHALPLLRSFLQIGKRVLKTLDGGQERRPFSPGTANGGGIVPVGAGLTRQREESHPRGLEGGRAATLCTEGCPGLGDPIQGHPLGMWVGERVATLA